MEDHTTYLPEPIYIDAEKIGLTRTGLQDMIDHYQHILRIVRPEQMSDDARKHCEQIIEKYKFHIILYDKHKAK